MPKQRVPQIFTLIRFYVDPLILIPSIQHEKSDYLFQDNRFFLSDPLGARTISFIQLIINHLSNSPNLSPPISSEIGFYVLHK